MTGCEQCYSQLQQRDWLEQYHSRLQQVTGCEQCYSRLQQRDWLRAVLQSITAT